MGKSIKVIGHPHIVAVSDGHNIILRMFSEARNEEWFSLYCLANSTTDFANIGKG